MPVKIIAFILMVFYASIDAAELPIEKVNEYILACKVKERYEHSIETYYQEVQRNYPYMENVKDEYISMLKEMWSYEKYKETGISVLNKMVTEKELDEMIKLVKTDLGQKALSIQQESSDNWAKYTFKKSSEYSEKMKDLYKKASDIALAKKSDTSTKVENF
jgi:hypothetical protein